MVGRPRRTLLPVFLALIVILGVAVDPGTGQPVVASTGAPAGTLIDALLKNAAVGYGTSSPHVCVINASGGLVCQGSNDFGQIGNGTTDDATTPFTHPTPLNSGVTQVIASNRLTCAVKDGKAWCWGGGFWNDASNFVARSTPTPVKVIGGVDIDRVIDIAAGFDWACALREADNGSPRSVWCWGKNSGGVGSGGGTPTDEWRPQAVKVLEGDVRTVSIAHSTAGSACALMGDGTVQCWGGNNGSGQLGRGDNPTRVDGVFKPAAVTGLTGVSALASGTSNHCALKTDATVWCWGSNTNQELADGTTTARSTPAPSTVLPSAAVNAGEKVIQLKLDINTGFAVTDAQTLYEWGGSQADKSPKVSSRGFGASNDREGLTVAAMVDKQGFCRITSSFTLSCVGLAVTGDTSGITPPFPSAPTIDQLTVGETGATVTLSATTPGATPTHFHVTASAQAPNTGVVSVTCPVGGLCVIPGLTNGVTYTLEATASNADGVSGPSFWNNGATFTTGPIAPPLTPLLEAGDQTVTISPQPGDGGTPSRYIVFLEPGGHSCEVINPATSCAINGLSNGTEYTVTTSAINETGESDPSEPATVIIGPAAPPLAPTVVVDDRQATVTINPSATISANTPGGTPSYYTVTASASGQQTVTCRVTPPATSCLLENLINGVDYTFETTATNGTGTTDPSPTITTLVDVLPHPPQAPQVVIAPNGVTLSSIPAITGGSVSTITISAQPSNPTKFCTIAPPATECFIAGLDANALYTFEAVAGNQLGESQPAVTPALIAPPAPPSIDVISLDSSGGLGDLTVTVSADTGTSGGPPANFRIYAFEQPAGPLSFCDVTVPDSSCTIGGLTPGSTYTVTASAGNELGTSGGSDPTEISLIPPLAPEAPSIISVANSEATVSVNPTTSGAPASFYTVTASATGQPTVSCTVTPPATSCVLSPLVNGVTYDVITTASNVFGTSPASDPTSLFLRPPAEPPAPLVTPGDGQATVTVGPGEGGGIPSSYLVIATDPDGVEVARCTVTPPPTTCVLTPLTNGVEYTVSLSASNDFGTTTASATTTVTPRAAPTGILPGPLVPNSPVVPSTPVPADPSTGRLPQQAPGEVAVITDGRPTTVTVVVENQTDLVVRNADFELRLIAECATFCPITTDESGRQLIQLERDGSVRVSGRGFQPESPVLVWLFSDPRLLGELTVADDGTFAGTLPIGVLEPGLHTLQVNGVSMDNTLRTANLGVMVMALEVTEPSIGGELPATGKDLSGLTAQLIILALCFLGLGRLLRNPAATAKN